MTVIRTDVAVVGGGPAGLAAALLLARAGAGTLLVAPPPRPDARTTALLEGSVAILREAGLWEGLLPFAAPLRSLRIVDAGRRLFRAPEALFHASELGLEAFGWNVPNARLTDALAAAFADLPSARSIACEVLNARPRNERVALSLADGRSVEARLAVAADGARSRLREAAGMSMRSRSAGQTALAFAVSHERDHDGVSTELHYEDGPFTLVPMPGRRSSVVWAMRPDRAEALRAVSDEALGEAATKASGRLLGRLSVEGGRGAFPIEIGAALRLAARRTMLVGEAGHVLPPIGAQGLNLGMRDAAAVARIVGEALGGGRDPGGSDALSAYARARAADVLGRAAATDLLNRSLTTDLAPAHALRSFGIAALTRNGPLRRAVMRVGLGAG